MARLYDFDPYEGDLPNDVVAPVDRADFPAVVPATPAQLAKLLLSMPVPEGGFPAGSLGAMLLRAMLYVEATAVDLVEMDHAVNTIGKAEKLICYETTNKRWYSATGSAPEAPWRPVGAISSANDITPV